ncbi:MAG: A/G-specific adenine glycosylase [Terriglobia bacterium]
MGLSLLRSLERPGRTSLCLRRLHQRLLAWFDRHRRDLPWRRPAAQLDPYRIWLAETMLQQTRVPVVLPYYRRFRRAFPTVRHLAAARLDRVLALWAGLGYYQRARNLHRAAQRIVRRHGGRFPQSLAAALGLPGVGPYTARAVLSIAYREPLAVVDGNVARVLARLFRLRLDDSQPARARLQPLADRLLAPRRPGDYNQALMELGSTLCLPKLPRCPACPLEHFCAARQAGIEHTWPARSRKTGRRPHRRLAVLVLHRPDARPSGRLLLAREARGPFGGLWHFPYAKLDHHTVLPRTLQLFLRRRQARLLAPRPCLRLRHPMTTGDLDLTVFLAVVQKDASYEPYGRLGVPRPQTHPHERWVTPAQLKQMAVGAATRKIVAAVNLAI